MDELKNKKLLLWKYAIHLNQIDGKYEPSNELKKLIQKEINNEITTEEIAKKLVEKYSK